MEKSLEDKLYDSVLQDDMDAVLHLVSQGNYNYLLICEFKVLKLYA